jgi:hypothetical protein
MCLNFDLDLKIEMLLNVFSFNDLIHIIQLLVLVFKLSLLILNSFAELIDTFFYSH